MATQETKEYTSKNKERDLLVQSIATKNPKLTETNMKTRIIIMEQKSLYGHFRGQRKEIAHEITRTRLRERNVKRRTESLSIVDEKITPILLCKSQNR